MERYWIATECAQIVKTVVDCVDQAEGSREDNDMPCGCSVVCPQSGTGSGRGCQAKLCALADFGEGDSTTVNVIGRFIPYPGVTITYDRRPNDVTIANEHRVVGRMARTDFPASRLCGFQSWWAGSASGGFT
jgi:hypothetical protein